MAHILVIDDDADVRQTFATFLERFGHVVSLAENGTDGLRMFIEESADLVITDVFMPEMDGLELIIEIRKLGKKMADHLPVIAVSSGIDTSTACSISFLNQAKMFGADRVFPKPIDFSGVQTAINELLTVQAA